MLLFEIPGGFEWFIVLFVILAFCVWLVVLFDIVRNHFEPSNEKLTWLMLVILLPVVGAVLYLAIGRSQKVSS